ncbi:nucleolar complex protein 4 homolog isoform X2 [Cimex lectularius]|uniref:CCAAT-binding factor domain-containing protein n=1 Tax=Cimex lectularius TaxID=79782 RepID=A0A8I6RTG9_CIMLE|nr:nucleolar complex protein 4 homolog isoform X2 [Cimex lectularius]
MSKTLKCCLEELKKEEGQILNFIPSSFKENLENVSEGEIVTLGEIITLLIRRYSEFKDNVSYKEWLLITYKEGKDLLNSTLKKKGCCSLAAFKLLIDILPSEREFLQEKPNFPDEKYAEIIKALVYGDSEFVNSSASILQEYMIYEDMNLNIWKALDIALNSPLTGNEVRNSITVINLFKPSQKNQEMPKNYFCKTKIGILNSKKMSETVRSVWEKMMVVELPPRTKQLLLVTLLEKIMPLLIKPVFLTDFFMSSLESGGAITLLSLQGIFELIQKHNINYPNIYDKLYDMFKPEIFETTYKARFYYLADLFLSSLHLTEALVASFAKRLARLALVAPPPDIIILMGFITNLIIRHPGLSSLITNMKTSHMESDPYLEDEKDPMETQAIKSCLWEILILQNHVLPNVSYSAMFINNPLPTVEVNVPELLEVTLDEMFDKEVRKKLKDPPLVFEKPTPTYLSLENNKYSFVDWELTK